MSSSLGQAGLWQFLGVHAPCMQAADKAYALPRLRQAGPPGQGRAEPDALQGMPQAARCLHQGVCALQQAASSELARKAAACI